MTRPKLLLADDSITIRKVVELTFADEGIDVSTVADSRAAMQKFVEVQPDIMLVDVGLTDTNGYRICEMIKQDPATQHIPVLLLVGSFEPFDQEEAERCGADGFLTKPFHSIRDLVTRVWDLLGGIRAAETQPEEPVASASTPETADIESLYQNSFGETVEIQEFDTVDDLLGDSGMDDDMIEASYPREANTAQTFTEDSHEIPPLVENVEQSKEFDWSPESMVTGTPPPEPVKPAFEPKFTFAEPDELPLETSHSAVDADSERLAKPEDYPDFQAAEPAFAVATESSHSEDKTIAINTDKLEIPQEEDILETSDYRSESWPPPFFLNVDDDHPPITGGIPAVAETPATEQSAEPAILANDYSVSETVEDIYAEPDIHTTLADPEMVHANNFPASVVEPKEDSADFQVLADESRSEQPIQLETRTPTPEYIAMIAQRVIEHLSDKIVREIAQDAVPRIAEKLIREALEEGNKG